VATEEFIDLGNGVAFVRSFETVRPVGSPPSACLKERWGYVYVVGERGIVRVVASRRVDQVRLVAERLAQERADG
jgi:hypothetical protein